jgi:lysophospholipase L1-like esterase
MANQTGTGSGIAGGDPACRADVRNYQKLVCWGDSQTFGARTYGCYPLYLVRSLNRGSRYVWTAINFCRNGYTARDLWFRLGPDLLAIKDVPQACVLIGANDVGNATPVDLFAEYFSQLLSALAIAKLRVVHCGEIPPIWADGHAYFAQDTEQRRAQYNAAIEHAVSRTRIARLVRFPDLTPEDFVDPVHFSESGNLAVAEAFAASVKAF